VDQYLVSFTKWGDRRHWYFEVEHLADDDHGRWFLGRPGIALQRGDEPPVLERDGFVMLVPGVGDWIAFWNVDDDIEIYVDVCRDVAVAGTTITAIDMDLDVVRRRDGTVEVLDEDEFEEHGRLYAYPEGVAEEAVAVALDLVAAIKAERDPFSAVGSRRLAEAWDRWSRGSQQVSIRSY
jgi:hypothetical protein